MRQLSGDAAEQFLNEQIADHRAGILRALAPFEPKSAFYAWLETLRAVEEFINLPLVGLEDDEALERKITSLRLDHLQPAEIAHLRHALTTRFDAQFAQRFILIIVQAAAIRMAFLHHGFMEAAGGLETVGHAVGYFQSRRRHLVALLYTIPDECRGKRPLEQWDTLNQFLVQAEYSGIALTGLYHKLMLTKLFSDFKLHLDQIGFVASHHFEILDNLFLDPERAGIVEMVSAAAPGDRGEPLEPVDRRRLFSAAELRNDIRLIEAAYAEFNLANTSFSSMANFIRQSLVACEDDYLVKLSNGHFLRLLEEVGLPEDKARYLTHHGGDYVVNTNEFAPFIRIGDDYVSTVTLLSRFLYHWKTVCLNRVRRFQIRSGFIFEESVKSALTKQGFNVTGIKRINRKEFDVVATLDGIIYNVQCKNNLIDLNRIEADPAHFVKFNRRLDRYYAAALRKEEGREQLLKDTLRLTEVRHAIVSRFPIATLNPRVISYSRIGEFKQKMVT